MPVKTKQNKPPLSPEEKIFRRNFWMFPIGTIGRDFLFNFFNGYLLSFILLTKNLTAAQFASITVIIICARIFDAMNDPIMGGIVENTRSRFGKYKPWQLLGAVLTGVVIILLFNLPLYGWNFIGMLAASYFLFSITFTMNDISYWGMMPTLTSDAHNRNKLTSATQIFAGIGGAISSTLVPVFTTGNIGTAAFGSVSRAFGVFSIVAATFMVGFQLFTIFGVVEQKLPTPRIKAPRLKFKDIFKCILKNDQLLWAAICLLLFNIGTNAFTGGLTTMYIYFEFGYDGMLTVLFAALSAVMGALFTLFFPILCKKWGRTKVLLITSTLAMLGYIAILFIGLFVPNTGGFDLDLFGFHFHFTLKFILLVIANMTTGINGMYIIQTINMANSVEYNELRTGKREESLIFSLRSLTNKMGSAIAQGVISLVYVISGVLLFTNRISDIENAYSHAGLTAEEAETKLSEIGSVLHSVPEKNKHILLICMCVIPVVFILVALILHKRFCKLDEAKMDEINRILAERHAAEAKAETQIENADA